MGKDYDLQNRLIAFAGRIVRLAKKLHKYYGGHHIAGQLTRSGTSPAMHYGEAQAAESRKDFIHKMKVCLKELNETLNSLLLIDNLEWLDKVESASAIQETKELISIFVKSIDTATKNGGKPP
jgi:four helix bundle protein